MEFIDKESKKVRPLNGEKPVRKNEIKSVGPLLIVSDLVPLSKHEVPLTKTGISH